MGRVLASLVVAAFLLSVASSEASAWVCRAAGLGSGGWGRSYSIIDAKLWALRRCENYSRCRSARSCGVVPVAERLG
jgi:hypothetical protein